MASTSRRRVGRPKLPGCLKTIRLRDSVFNLWRSRKQALGFLDRTDSEFAEFLLHRRWVLQLEYLIKKFFISFFILTKRDSVWGLFSPCLFSKAGYWRCKGRRGFIAVCWRWWCWWVYIIMKLLCKATLVIEWILQTKNVSVYIKIILHDL